MDPGLNQLLRSLADRAQLVHVEHLPARPPRIGTLARPLPPPLRRCLPEGGLWSHQAVAVDLARAGRSVAISTGTASGKTLCYQLPIAEAVGNGGSALLVFPTKALAQDQLRSLAALGAPGLVPATYDGDTPTGRRAWVRRHANAVLTNPDMLHVGILPAHERWSGFLSRLRFVVLDELHTLRGIFGTHVAHVLRRLRRLCAHYGADPTFVFCSATMGRPAALASSLCGLPVEEVTDDGSPRGERLFALWNPPLLDEASGERVSANTETARLMAALVAARYRTIAFTRSRTGAELVASYARRQLPPELARRVRPYRGGYLAAERREIESQLFGGRLLGVVATTALELGIDVGGLDACVLDGFPGTIASLWQQAGRAGRARQRSAAVLVAGPDQLDQWLMCHPSEVFTRPPEPAVVNPANPFVLRPHLACAAYELPLTSEDEAYWEELDEGVRQLAVVDRLVVRAGRAFSVGPGSPAPRVGLRTGSAEEYRIVDGRARLIGTVDAARAFSVVHPGAIYLHQGQQYRVRELDLADRAAWVEPVQADELTQARTETSVSLLATERTVAVGGARLAVGDVEVVEQVTAYQRRRIGTREVLETAALDLPPSRLVTRAFWYTLDQEVLARAGLAPARVGPSAHAAEHAGIGILPLFTICDRWDVGGLSTAFHAQTGRATIVIYDGYPGGAGIAELGFGAGRRHLDATLEVIAACPCRTGCPSCVQSPKCGNWNEHLDKAGSVALLRAVLAAEPGGARRHPRGR